METNSIISQIGNTPLVRLKQASELTGCNIYGKAEYFNPGESVKDRAALFIVEDAIKRKLISKGGTMIWNYTDKAELFMKKFSEQELNVYLSKISDKALYAYNVYQIEGEGKKLFSEIKGNVDTIMGLPIKSIKQYLENIK